MHELRHSPANPRDEEDIREYFAQSAKVIDLASSDSAVVGSLVKIADTIASSLRNGGKILLAGNGGSAGDAQHIAGEFLSRLNFDRAPLAALALTVDTSVLTAIGNDYGYEQVFERQVRGLGRAGDVFVGISTSGRSPNVLRAIAAARECKLVTVGFTGANGSSMIEQCDLAFVAPSTSTPLIQQLHLIAAHIVCGMVEAKIFGGSA